MGFLASLLQCGHAHRKRKKTYQTVELKIRMDCDGCELKVKKALSFMKGIIAHPSIHPSVCLLTQSICLVVGAGVQSVEINRKQNKVTVNGYVEPNKVLKRVQSTGKKAEIWPYVPYNLVVQPYVAGTYDKRAPPGYVRNLELITAQSQNRQEEQLVYLFSDDNPNACSVM
ncbi:Heavy metal-associated isoprenylated plant protein 26 [Platanthera guangdongensis]|uniref:Heavy metal-associated isoprenylated plant protein 26 n=1 Tax=Platanthera guangdongensis TaxID=2320717 RepID=A0ABR2LS32_9ASPA